MYRVITRSGPESRSWRGRGRRAVTHFFSSWFRDEILTRHTVTTTRHLDRRRRRRRRPRVLDRAHLRPRARAAAGSSSTAAVARRREHATRRATGERGERVVSVVRAGSSAVTFAAGLLFFAERAPVELLRRPALQLRSLFLRRGAAPARRRRGLRRGRGRGRDDARAERRALERNGRVQRGALARLERGERFELVRDHRARAVVVVRVGVARGARAGVAVEWHVRVLGARRLRRVPRRAREMRVARVAAVARRERRRLGPVAHARERRTARELRLRDDRGRPLVREARPTRMAVITYLSGEGRQSLWDNTS